MRPTSGRLSRERCHRCGRRLWDLNVGGIRVSVCAVCDRPEVEEPAPPAAHTARFRTIILLILVVTIILILAVTAGRPA